MLKFNEGIHLRQKMDAKVVSEFMRESGEFAKEEFVTWQQISAGHVKHKRKQQDNKDFDVCANEIYRMVYPNLEEKLQEELYIIECFEK